LNANFFRVRISEEGFRREKSKVSMKRKRAEKEKESGERERKRKKADFLSLSALHSLSSLVPRTGIRVAKL
jgi:hypothetical protein